MSKILDLTLDEFEFVEKHEFKMLLFKDKNSEKYFQAQDAYKYTDQDVQLGLDNYYIELNDQRYSSYGGIMLIQLYDGKIIFNLELDVRKRLEVSAVIVDILDMNIEKIEELIFKFFDKNKIRIRNNLRAKKINVIKLPLNYRDYDMDYSIRNLSTEEYNQLMAEFDPADYENYDGVLKPWNVWNGIEVVMHIGEKFEAKELTEYRKKYHPYCTESAPFLLNDNRVLLINVISASLFDSVDDYLKEVKSWPRMDNDE